MDTSKMVKLSRGLDKAIRILQIVMIACGIAVVVFLGIFTVMNALDRSSVRVMIGDSFNVVDLGPVTFTLAGAYTPDNTTIFIHAWVMVALAAVFVAAAYYMLGIFRKILKPMTEGNPFFPSISKEIRKLAFVSLVIGLIENTMGVINTLNTIRIFDLNHLLQNSKITEITANFHYDLGFVATFFVLLLMSHIFHYGEGLQKLSDETL